MNVGSVSFVPTEDNMVLLTSRIDEYIKEVERYVLAAKKVFDLTKNNYNTRKPIENIKPVVNELIDRYEKLKPRVHLICNVAKEILYFQRCGMDVPTDKELLVTAQSDDCVRIGDRVKLSDTMQVYQIKRIGLRLHLLWHALMCRKTELHCYATLEKDPLLALISSNSIKTIRKKYFILWEQAGDLQKEIGLEMKRCIEGPGA